MSSNLVFIVVPIVLAIIIFTFLAFLLYKKNYHNHKCPSIVITSHDSPTTNTKHPWSGSDSDKKISFPVAKKLEKVTSFWYPMLELEPFLTSTTNEFQQDVLPKDVSKIST